MNYFAVCIPCSPWIDSMRPVAVWLVQQTVRSGVQNELVRCRSRTVAEVSDCPWWIRPVPVEESVKIRKPIFLSSLESSCNAYVVITAEHALERLTQKCFATVQFQCLLIWLWFFRFRAHCFRLIGQAFGSPECRYDPIVKEVRQIPGTTGCQKDSLVEPMTNLEFRLLARKCKYIRGRCKAPAPTRRECKWTLRANNDTKPTC